MYSCQEHHADTRQWRLAVGDRVCGVALGDYWCSQCQRVYDSSEICTEKVLGGTEQVHICGAPVTAHTCTCHVTYIAPPQTQTHFGWVLEAHPLRWMRLQWLLLHRRRRLAFA